MTIVQGGLLYAALFWKIYQLSRAPRDLPLRLVTLCLGCAAVAYPFGVAADSSSQPAIGPILFALTDYALLCGVIYTLYLFFVFSALEPRQAKVVARRQAIPLAVTVTILVIAAVTTPPTVRIPEYPVENVSVFYIAADLYLSYGLAMTVLAVRRHAKGAQPRLRRGLRLTMIASASMSAGAALLGVGVLINWTGTPPPVALTRTAVYLLLPGILLFLVGISYPGVATRLAALRVWWNHVRTHRQLAPLWTVLHEAFPQDALNRRPLRPWRDTVSLRGVHRRYYRRVIECRDGLVRISPYLAQVDDGPLPDRLRAALQSHASGESVASQAMPVAVPAGDGLDADVNELVALSRSLR
jgi:hypothetical protein